MYCSKCGKELQDDMIFCPKCGAGIGHEPKGIDPARENIKASVETGHRAEKSDKAEHGAEATGKGEFERLKEAWNKADTFGAKMVAFKTWLDEPYWVSKKSPEIQAQKSTGKRKKESMTSVMALVLSFIPVLSVAGFIVAIVDLINNDGTESHTCSKISLIPAIVVIILSVVIAVNIFT